MSSNDLGWYVVILGPEVVSKPCWQKLLDSSTGTKQEVTVARDEFYSEGEIPEKISAWVFVYSDFDQARSIAETVQRSARNRRKNAARQEREKEAGGHYTQEVIDKLFAIQLGRCYYSGDVLTREPKNFDIDHLLPVYLGGTNWPANLALVKTSINKMKGGISGDNEVLDRLEEQKGPDWRNAQVKYMAKVDKKRLTLDINYRKQTAHDKTK